MRSHPVESSFRRLAICILVSVAGLWSAASEAGKLSRPDATLGARVPAVAAATTKSIAAVDQVVEFYHAGLDHYFITANPAEQAVVDSGAVGAWQRTGNTFAAGCNDAECPIATNLGNGAYLVNLIIEISNPGATPIELVIPAGQTFIASPSFYQDGIAMERLAATIAPGTTARFVLFLFCIEQDGDGSNSGTTYTLGPVTTNAQLLDLIALVKDKLGASRDPAHIKSEAVQSAVWEITDGSGMLSVNSRNLLISLLDTSAADVTTQAALNSQFQATLTRRN